MVNNYDSNFLYYFDDNLSKRLTNFDHSLTEFSSENKTSTSYNLNGTKLSLKSNKSPSIKQHESINVEQKSSSTQADLISEIKKEEIKSFNNHSSKISRRFYIFIGITLSLILLICIALVVLAISIK